MPTCQNINIEITIEEEKWLEEVPSLKALIGEVSQTVFSKIEILNKGSNLLGFEISFLFTDDQTIQSLNKDYRGKNKPTNVLSFPLESRENIGIQLESKPLEAREILLGDIILAFGVVSEEAKIQNKSSLHHISHLIIHGILHLLGYDHVLDDEAEKMEALEVEVLEELGISNPYLIK